MERHHLLNAFFTVPPHQMMWILSFSAKVLMFWIMVYKGKGKAIPVRGREGP
jgi:hypothetical protein